MIYKFTKVLKLYLLSHGSEKTRAILGYLFSLELLVRKELVQALVPLVCSFVASKLLLTILTHGARS